MWLSRLFDGGVKVMWSVLRCICLLAMEFRLRAKNIVTERGTGLLPSPHYLSHIKLFVVSKNVSLIRETFDLAQGNLPGLMKLELPCATSPRYKNFTVFRWKQYFVFWQECFESLRGSFSVITSEIHGAKSSSRSCVANVVKTVPSFYSELIFWAT